jgi:signal transduction histidine kinase
MSWRMKMFLAITFLLSLVGRSCLGEDSASAKTNLLVIQSLTVANKPVSIAGKTKIRLGPNPENIFFNFGFNTNADRRPIRLARKLEGYDNNWNIGGGEMFLVVRFYDHAGGLIAKNDFEVRGDSAGWRNNLTDSALTHRRETVVAPPHASHFLVIITSAGPQATEGVYVVSDLTVSAGSSNGQASVLLQFPDDRIRKSSDSNSIPDMWVRDGITPGMAKIIDLGAAPSTKALEIVDDDPLGHAEWHNNLEFAPAVVPGESLIIEWNEMFSIGEGGARYSAYPSLPPGNFTFRVQELGLMGSPTGVEASLAIFVPPPFWRTLWFWGVIAALLFASTAAALRYVIQIRTQRKLLLLEKERLLERERLRIARDIHDDLGARVTQISLVSAMAHDGLVDADAMRGELVKISHMSRDLVTALYETVWTVNPENDNLKELGNYLFQMINDLCERSQFRCRFHIEELPSDVTVPSHIRHNLCMVMKEAMNNIVKHAGASEVRLSMSFRESHLTVSIQDDGRGFVSPEKPTGHGLTNMKQRLEEIGGSCRIESRPGEGTTILIYLNF